MQEKNAPIPESNRRNGLLGTTFLAALVSLCTMASTAHAISCWAVTGWSSDSYSGAQAFVTATSCTTIPQNQGWTEVYYGVPESDSLWLRISLNDSWVSGWLFRPLLVFRGFDLDGKPIVTTDVIVSTDDYNYMWLLPYPPLQGTPTIGSRVRLRHRATGKCAYSLGQNGGSVYNWACWNDPTMVYLVDDAGGGQVRLRHEQTGQCLYAVNQNGASLYHWACWSDPNMAFTLDLTVGGYRLRHVNTGKCAYGNATNGGEVHVWDCWDDSNMVFNLDIIN